MKGMSRQERTELSQGSTRWRSLFGLGVMLFLGYGALNSLAALVVPWIYHLSGGMAGLVNRGTGILVSGPADQEFFGRSDAAVLLQNPDLAVVYDLLFDVMLGLYGAVGVLQLSMVWFGLRRKEPWAFWTVILADSAASAGWLAFWAHFRARGVDPGLGLPPVFLYALFLLPPAALLTWIGMRQEQTRRSTPAEAPA